MNQSIVVYGPQGCGKTINGQRLRRHFGLIRVIEEDEFDPNKPVLPMALVLTTERPKLRFPDSACIISFDEAMRAAGFARGSKAEHP